MSLNRLILSAALIASGVAGFALSAAASGPETVTAYKALTLQAAMPRIRKEIFHKHQDPHVMPLKDGTLTYMPYHVDDYDQGYQLRFKRAKLTVAQAKAVVAIIQDEPVYLDKPRPFSGGLAFAGQEWEATGESTIEVRFYLRDGLVSEIVLKKSLGAE